MTEAVQIVTEHVPTILPDSKPLTDNEKSAFETFLSGVTVAFRELIDPFIKHKGVLILKENITNDLVKQAVLESARSVKNMAMPTILHDDLKGKVFVSNQMPGNQFVLTTLSNGTTTTESTCLTQRQELVWRYKGRMQINQVPFSLPIDKHRSSSVAAHMNVYTHYRFVRMPLLVIGVRTPLFAVLLANVSRRHNVHSVTAIGDAMTAIGMYPMATSFTERDNQEDDSFYNKYMRAFEDHMDGFRNMWWDHLLTIITRKEAKGEKQEEEEDEAQFVACMRDFFIALISFTLDFIATLWNYAMNMYNIGDSNHILPCGTDLGFDKCVAPYVNFPCYERVNMIDEERAAEAYRKSHYHLTDVDATRLADADMLLTERFPLIYAHGNTNPCVPFEHKCKDVQSFLGHINHPCASCPADKGDMLPQTLTVGGLFQLFKQCKHMIANRETLFTDEKVDMLGIEWKRGDDDDDTKGEIKSKLGGILCN